MKLLYISIIHQVTMGLAESVPCSIKAQTFFDECGWLNINDFWMENWNIKNCICVHGKKYLHSSFEEILNLFFKPDLIIFEGFNDFYKCSFYSDIIFNKIPYIIVPRYPVIFNNLKFANYGILGRNSKALSCMKEFVNNALAIQHLNKENIIDSDYYNTQNIILPNGTNYHSYVQKEWYPGKEIVISYLGRPSLAVKGLDLLCLACKSIKEKLIKNKVVINIHTTSTGKDAKTIRPLSRLIDQNELDNIIKIHPIVIGNKKNQILKKSDMVILPSRLEGMPMIILEAISNSCPCFVTEPTNMSQIITKAGAGYSSQANIESIAKTLSNIIDEFPVFHEIMRKNAYSLAQQYLWTELAKEAHTTYQTLLNRLSRKLQECLKVIK